jgi:hypothetical protein
MSLVGLMGADHAFYYERARVLLPFRTGARTYVSLHRPRCGSNTARDRRAALIVIGRLLKDQYNALATPVRRISLHSLNSSKRKRRECGLVGLFAQD